MTMAAVPHRIAFVAMLGVLPGMAYQALIPLPASVQTCPGEFPATKPVVKMGSFGNSEAYSLTVGPRGVAIEAASKVAELHALRTLAQLRVGDKYPCVRIEDQPRFAWRGLLLDVSRHFMPVDVVMHTLDRMAAVKLNVLHFHLADDQGVRVESKRYPRLQERASGGQYYTQEQLKGLVAYAQELGIRIVPEFDFPGHATAWFAAYPELASAPGPYAIERKIGIFDPAFDPSNPKTYEFIEGFLSEMATNFPDAYVHLGGDEVNGKHWDASARIQAFKKSKGLVSNHDLQVYFEDRMHGIVTKLGKKLVLWDEAIHAKSAGDITYQAWRGPNALLASAFLKHPTLVSYGFYLDWGLSTAQLYRNQLNGVLPDETDPILKRLNPLIKIPAARPAGMMTEAEGAQRLGGEACMWSEFTIPANLDLRLWPRAAVVAERLWSPGSQDLDDLYRRLRAVFPQPAGKPLEDVLEPGKYVYRHLSRKYTVDSPMDQLVDRLAQESQRAQEFNRAVVKREYPRAKKMLEEWRVAGASVSGGMDPALAGEARKAIGLGLEALEYLGGKSARPGEGWAAASVVGLKAMSDNRREIVVAIAPGVMQLVQAVN